MKKSRKKRLRRLAERVVERHRRRQNQSTITGILRMTASGFGFVTPDPELHPDMSEDIFIPAKYVNRAIDSDCVEVALLPPRRSWDSGVERGPAGKITAVVQRERNELVGELLAGSLLRPLDPKLPEDIQLYGARHGARRGDWVRVKFDDDGCRRSGHILEVIGRAGVIAADLDAVIAEFDLPPRYTEKEEEIALAAEPREIPRTDCCDLYTLTIDPTDAKDFDDALSVEPSPVPDCVTLGVHISDVAAYVPPRSKIDEWALKRAFSCYLPGRTLPMLPAGLTAKISLQANQKSLAHSVFLTVNTVTGEVVSGIRKHTLIAVDHRLDYDTVQEFHDTGKAPENWDKKLRSKVAELLKLTQTMRRFRENMEKFIDLPLPEIRVICDEKNNSIEGLKVKFSREAENMVEECMLAANQFVGIELQEKSIAGIYRTHAIPEAEKTEEFALSMRDDFNLPVGDISNREVCRNFIAALPDDSRRNVILSLLLRTMPRALYQVKPDIHFALGKSRYCHFTSPIRRCTDLIVHQQLWNHDCNIRTRNGRTIEKAALWCSEQEEVIDNAGFAASDRMKLRYLEEELSRDASRIYEGIIIRVLNAGFQVDIAELGIYGFVRKERMRGNFLHRSRRLDEENSRTGYKVGNYVYLRLDSIDFARGTANFVPA